MAPLLEVSQLRLAFAGGVDALRGVSFSLEHGDSLAVVGESGAGKSTLAHAVTGLVQAPAATGSVRLAGRELLGAPIEQLRAMRWSTVAIALQGAPFNPVTKIGDQIAEPLRQHAGMASSAARRRAAELAEELLLDVDALDRFPHELSGGERRRAMMAMVFALDPRLVVLDEPAAGLDHVAREQLLDRVAALTAARGCALLIVSHDLPAATRLGARTLVLYAGEVMEDGPSADVLARPAHPYSWALVNAYPVMTTTKDLRPIRGDPPDPRLVPPGCPFHPRCTQAEVVCVAEHPALEPSGGRLVACHFGGLKTLLFASGLHKTFGDRARRVPAVQGVSLTVAEGEAVGVVGASGSGKSTLARMLTGHLRPDAGDVVLEGTPLGRSWCSRARALHRRVQLVMQDPWDALSPRLTVRQLVREPLDIAATGDRASRERLVGDALEAVGLPPTGGFLDARADELSGGELQRAALARAVVARPKLLVADEPTSMLDASEQARLLVLLRELQVQMGMGLVLISHDVALVRKVTDRILVLEAGRIVEDGRSEAVSFDPRSAAARRLVDAAPAWKPAGGDRRHRAWGPTEP